MTVLLDEPEVETGPGTYPVPPGRGRWRLTLHRRVFNAAATYEAGLLGELTNARGRRLEAKWNAGDTLTFTLDGHDAEALLVRELQHDVIAWRWDDVVGTDVPMFRGIVGQSEDQLTTEKHVVTFTCHDYFAAIGRRILTTAYAPTATDQDNIIAGLMARGVSSSAGFNFAPGSYLPISPVNVNPDGTARGLSGTLRDRSYAAQQNIGTAITDLAAVIGGFDFDVVPMGMADHETDALRIFFPQQGVTRSVPVLEWGGGVSTVQRSFNSADYGNYVRVQGNQQFGEAYNPDASGVVVGLWPYAANAPDVTLAATCTQQAQGTLAYNGVISPTYSLTLTPGFFYYGMFNMGDTLPLVVMSGRLQVNTAVRVVGITYDINDDGDENVELTVGRPVATLTSIFGKTAADVAALSRR